MVGSMPSFTRSGEPPRSCSASLPSGSTSTALRVRSGTRAMLDCRLRAGAPSGAPAPYLLDGRPSFQAPATWRRRWPAPAPPAPPPKQAKPRLKKLRVLFVLLGLGILGLVSTVFGMMAAVSQDLPEIYNFAQYKASKNSEVFDATGEPLGTLTSDQNKILLSSGQISPNVKNAVVAIEDLRYFEHSASTSRGSPAPWSKTCSARAPPRALRRSPSSSSRTRSKRRASARSSSSSARRRSPTNWSTTGARTRSSPSTSTRSTSARAPTASRRPPAPTSAPPTPAAGRLRSPAPRCWSPGRRPRWRR